MFLKTDIDWDQSTLSKRPDWLIANLFFASLTPHFQPELLEKHAALIPPDRLQTWKISQLISACLEIESSPKFKLDASSRKAQGKVGGVHDDKRGKRDKRDKRDKKPDGKKSTPSRKQIMGDDGLPRITMGSLTTEQRMEARKAMNEARKTKPRVAAFDGRFQTYKTGDGYVDAVCYKLPGDSRKCCGAPGHFPDRCPVTRAAQAPSQAFGVHMPSADDAPAWVPNEDILRLFSVLMDGDSRGNHVFDKYKHVVSHNGAIKVSVTKVGSVQNVG